MCLFFEGSFNLASSRLNSAIRYADRREFLLQMTDALEGQCRLPRCEVTAFSHPGRTTGYDWGGGDDGADDGDGDARPLQPGPSPHSALQSRIGELNQSRTCSNPIVTGGWAIC